MDRGLLRCVICLLGLGIAGCGPRPAGPSGPNGPGADGGGADAGDTRTADATASAPGVDAARAAEVAPVASDARPDATRGTDDFLACPVGCTIDPCQTACGRDNSRAVQTPDHRVIQYRGQVSISRRPGDRSAIRCGTYDQQQNCDACWGVRLMDVQLPRVAFFAENVAAAGRLVHRVHIRYSWDALDAAGKPLPNFSPLTAIISRQDLRVVDPATGGTLSSASISMPSFVNPGRAGQCPTAPLAGAQDQRAFDLDLPVAATTDATDVIELTAVGNYE